MSSELTDSEGIRKGTKIYRPHRNDAQDLIRQGARPGHSQFRIQYRPQIEWEVAEHGIVCFCTKEIFPDWTGFVVVTVPNKGYFCHVEPTYD